MEVHTGLVREVVYDDLAANLPLLDAVRSVGIASMTLLWLEFIGLMDDEITYIWPTKWSAMKVLYFINRYSPFLDMSLQLSVLLGTTTTSSCITKFAAMSYLYDVGTTFSELVLIARTMALFDFHRGVSFMLVGMFVAMLISSMIWNHILFARATFPPENLLHITGCVPSIEGHPGWVLFAELLISETILVMLTIYKLWQTSFRNMSRSRIVTTLYRDGCFCYVAILVVTIINLVFMLVSPLALTNIIQMPLRVIHSTVCTRMLLRLRKAAAQLTQMTFDDLSQQSDIAFEGVSGTEHVLVGGSPMGFDSGAGRRACCELELEPRGYDESHFLG